MIAFAASLLFAAAVVPEGEPLLSTNATPAELVASCRAMVPAEVEITGRIVLRNRRGIPLAEHTYALRRAGGESTLVLDGGAAYEPAEGPILGTDVTWSDITLEYLWWDDFTYDVERVMESVHGQECLVVLMKKAGRTVRVWVDRRTGAMMQAEELADGKPVRRLWGTRIRKFGERWAPNVMEVETLGSGHRTKIVVETLEVKG